MKKITFIVIAMIAMFSCSKKLTPTAKKTTAAIEPVVSAATTVPGEPKVKVRTLLSDTMANNNASIKSASEVVENRKETPQVQSGKITYKTKCAKCHDAKDPQTYDAAKWVKIVDWMAPRAKLDATEKANVLAFVSLYAKG